MWTAVWIIVGILGTVLAVYLLAALIEDEAENPTSYTNDDILDPFSNVGGNFPGDGLAPCEGNNFGA